MALVEKTVLRSVSVIDGRLEVVRAEQVLRDDVVIHSTDATQVLTADVDLTALQLEPVVLAIAAAVWTPEHVCAACDALLQGMSERHSEIAAADRQKLQERLDEQQRLQAQLAEQEQETQARAQALERSRAAVAAAHRELDEEHQVLAARSEEITALRASTFAERERVLGREPAA